MSHAPLKISNRQARALWLQSQGLATAPTGALDVMEIIRKLGFVQLDSIQVVSRAHHHILWSRNQNYREPMMDRLLGKERKIFEHFTHDASVLPMEYLPMWQRQFARKKAKLSQSSWYSGMSNASYRDGIKARIAEEGSLSTHAFDTKIEGPKKMWSRPPHKLALDYMWFAGELATCHRVNFTKFYNLADRVFPEEYRLTEVEDQAQIDWLCQGALDRMGFGTLGEVQKYWDAVSRAEVQNWANAASETLRPVLLQSADDQWIEGFAPADIESRLNDLPRPTSRLRILNPFDPVIRDRTRLSRLFGFDYRVEMFVPAAKRQWGYYVYPILEGDRFVGRIEIKADRKAGFIKVIGFWPENGSKWGAARSDKLEAELARLARLIGVSDVQWQNGVARPA